jgi:hypothetical protein
MSEEQPLLSENPDPETGVVYEPGHPHHEWVRNFLESKKLHYFVLTLARTFYPSDVYHYHLSYMHNRLQSTHLASWQT